MTPLYHPSPRCLCVHCGRAYAMHYRFDWQGTPADVPAGTVTRNTPRW